MLIRTEYKEFELLDSTSFINKLLKEQYPKCYKILTKIQNMISPIQHEPEAIVMVCIFQKILNEWDEIYRKEKWFLFPYLNQLNIEAKKAENMTAFNYCKSNYGNLIETLAEFKLNLYVEKDLIPETFDEIKSKIELFEYNIVQIQKAKQELLFSKFYASII